MSIIKKYVRINLSQFSFSILFAILGVLASLISYIFLARIIAELISNNSDVGLSQFCKCKAFTKQ